MKLDLTELLRLYVIELRNNPSINSDQTIKSYCSAVTKFYSENSRIYRLSKNDLKCYLSGIRTNYSDSYYNVIGSAIKTFYVKVLKQPFKVDWFRPVKINKQFVDVMSYSEFVEMGIKCTNSKHKLILVILFSTGIRLGELLNIKLSDIDFTEKRIFIRTLKNGKNRHVPIHEITEKYLLKYLREWNPKVYLLNGQKSLKYSSSSVQTIISRISNGKYHPHSFRHKMITEIVDKENVFAAKEIAGHTNLSSTIHYNHISRQKLRLMYNPLDEKLAHAIINN